VGEAELGQGFGGGFDVGAAVPGAAAAVDDDLTVAREVFDGFREQIEAFLFGSGSGVERAGDVVASIEDVGPDLKNDGL